jgi:hypothetical protein
MRLLSTSAPVILQCCFAAVFAAGACTLSLAPAIAADPTSGTPADRDHPTAVIAGSLKYPAVIHERYEPVDARLGGDFVIWLDREKVFHGLNPKLFPAVKYVDVMHVTPAPGSPPITIIEVMSLNSNTPEFYHVAGLARFKITGMTLKSSNLPQQ